MEILGEPSLEFCLPHPPYLMANLWINLTVCNTFVNLEIKATIAARQQQRPHNPCTCGLIVIPEVVSKQGSWNNLKEQEVIFL